MIDFITKLARVYVRKYDLKRYGYEFDDVRSIASEVYLSSIEKFKGHNDCKTETYVSKCVNNMLLNIMRDELKKPLNHSVSMHDLTDNSSMYVIDEWLRVREILCHFGGIERVIVKEILEPSIKVTSTMKSVIEKHRTKKHRSNSHIERRLSISGLIFSAIKLTYCIPDDEFRLHMNSIKKRIRANDFDVDLY